MVAAAAAGTLLVGMVGVPWAFAGDGNNLKDRQREAKQQIRHAQHDLDESSSRLRRSQAALSAARAQLRDARGELQVANAKLTAARVRDDAMQRKLADAEQQLEEAEAALSDGRTALADQREVVTDTITDIYEQGDPELLAFSSLLSSQTPADLTRQMEARNVIVGRQTRAYDDLQAAEVLLEVRQGQVEEARDAVEVQREAAAERLVEMRALHRSARDAKVKVRGLVGSRAQAKDRARKARKRDVRDLRVAKQREARVRQLILAEMRRARGGYRGSTNGLFLRPVPGPVTSPYGYREHPIYHYWGLHDGTDFGVACGEGMKAIAGGTVIAKYWSNVYGNRLYLSLGTINGKNVTAVYNHASSYRVGVGDHVGRGEVVGYVGSTGWSTGCHLHFSILVNGTAVNPMSWLP